LATNGIITIVAGNGSARYSGDGGAATNASLNAPYGVALDAFGNLYIADDNNNCIRAVNFSTNPTFTLNSVSLANAGNYTVVISNRYGSVTSVVATLSVPGPAIIANQPASQMVGVGSSPGFSVVIANSGYAGPFGYEWYYAGTNLVQSGTNSTLTLLNVSTNNTGNYTVVVTNGYGSVTSQVATLTVLLPPSVTVQPISQTNLPGTPASFGVTVDGVGPFTYQWQFNGTNFPNNIITTVAGDGSATFAGDGGAATSASLSSPSGVTFDAAGNLFIADTFNHRIRKVDTNGIITTVAGKSGLGYSGDGGLATNASLNSPFGVAFDAFGNLFIADHGNNRIREVATNGIITTVAGRSVSGYSGDGGAATNASLYNPTGVAFDAAGNLFIADELNNRIRKVDTNGIITTVAGKSGSGYSGDGGAATNASLYYPVGITFDAAGNLYIVDDFNNRIRKMAANGNITTVAGKGGSGYFGDGGVATNANLDFPFSVAFDAFGNLYIADCSNNRIREVDSNGIITTVAGDGGATYAGDGGAATNASLYYPRGLVFDAFGSLYIADAYNNCIRKVPLAGLPIFSLPSVSVTNAGNYTVVITSPYGSVTSAVATLTVTIPQTPPQVIASGTNFGFAANQSGFGFNISGASGQTIVVDGSTNLVDWTPLYTNNAGNNPFYFLDTASTNFPWRFYRARLP
jgi:sugar lactone lactonase YvrE